MALMRMHLMVQHSTNLRVFFFNKSIYIPGWQTRGPDRSRYKVSYRVYETKAYVRLIFELMCVLFVLQLRTQLTGFFHP